MFDLLVVIVNFLARDKGLSCQKKVEKREKTSTEQKAKIIVELEIFLLVLHERTILPFYMRGRATSLVDSVHRRLFRLEARSEKRAPIFLIMIYAKFTRLDGGFPSRNGIYGSYELIKVVSHGCS